MGTSSTKLISSAGISSSSLGISGPLYPFVLILLVGNFLLQAILQTLLLLQDFLFESFLIVFLWNRSMVLFLLHLFHSFFHACFLFQHLKLQTLLIRLSEIIILFSSSFFVC